jgi:hypothetical protein
VHTFYASDSETLWFPLIASAGPVLDGIRSTRLLLVCLSPNYLESEYCAWEFNEYLKHEAAQALLESTLKAIHESVRALAVTPTQPPVPGLGFRMQ